jgi:hypothetical protein
MKSLYLLLLSLGTALTVLAQTSTLTIQVNGNRNKQLMVDGKSYDLYNSTGTSKNDPVTISDLKTGTHKIQFVRTNQNKTTSKNSKTVTLRSGYDLMVTVNGDGTIQTKETKINTTAASGPNYGDNNSNYTTLLANVKKQWKNSAKITLLKNAFNNSAYTFTTDETGQLISQVTGETNRLTLAKAAYPRISDQANYNNLDELLTTTASKNELHNYGMNNNNSSSGEYAAKSGMTDVKFNSLLKNVKNEWRSASRMKMIQTAFENRNNYFTTEQAGQLISLVTPEADRLTLAKASYRAIVDTARFTDLNELLNTTDSRNALAQYVYTYNGGTGTLYNNGTNNNGTYRSPMSDADYNTLYKDIQGQWMPFSKMTALTNAFSNSNNYFTTAQARKLILLVSDEDNRLELAKSAYRNITDPTNFSQMYDVLPTQSKRDELDQYAKNNKQ